MPYAGIICEYNPFHLGHGEHIRKTRELLGGGTGVICVMSGNFVQRGEPAIMEKHPRARAALFGGADLVLEIPAIWSTASAERFSEAGVHILASLGVPVTLSFGSECGDAEAIRRIAQGILSPEAQALTAQSLKDGVSYAAARQTAARELFGEEAELLKEPNNILGVEYLKAIIKHGYSHITPMTFKRIGTSHDGAAAEGLAPASLIRELLWGGGDVSEYMPKSALDIYNRQVRLGRAPVRMEKAEEAVLYRLRTMTDEEFSRLPDAAEGLDNRLALAGRTARSYAEVLENTKTKRYAMSRIRRMVLCAVLGITADMQRGLPPYIRVLGFNNRGREILHEVKKTASLPIITKPASARRLEAEARDVFELEARATDIYSLMCPKVSAGGGEWTANPVVEI